MTALQDEFEVAYARIVVVSIDAPEVQSAFRPGSAPASRSSPTPVACGSTRLELLEETDTQHRPYRPTALTLHPDLEIHRVYNGYWYWGARPRGPAPGHARDLARRSARTSSAMGELPRGAAYLAFDGDALHAGDGAGPPLRGSTRAACAGEPVADAYAHVCALADADAALRFDEPEIQQVRRDASRGGSRCSATRSSA